ncbi:MAG: 50S ribosomal protein L33 [Firmicutes bacterium]|uniref:Large ribosomal subunit protein bL33 n=1 Tax=Candidatus Alloenteromonas pullistercoris TaxID=2840785 RepID=A0A9D9DEV6_9FIRM|nr:50S ribosomal protein L33 [Candidatus Enteromonas pullistercoris]
MAKKRDQVILKCTVCGDENYFTTRNKKTHPNKMEINKYCPKCNKETLHKEKK